MKRWQPYRLLHGPYLSPKTSRGRSLFCEIRGTVKVSGMSGGRIPWPYAKVNGRPLILCGDLIRAVRRESNQAVAHHFGVSVHTVSKWRAALKVKSVNVGTRKLYQRVERKRNNDSLSRARANSKKPAALRNLSKSLKGRIQSPNTIEAVRKAAKRPRSTAWRAKMSDYWHRRGHPPGNPEAKFYSPKDDAMLGTAPDATVARLLKRSVTSVVRRRMRLGVAAFALQRWTPREDAQLGKATDAEVGRLLGRSEKAVATRRMKLGITAAGRPRWSREEDALLGTAPDEQIARRLGRTKNAVQLRRLARKIANHDANSI